MSTTDVLRRVESLERSRRRMLGLAVSSLCIALLVAQTSQETSTTINASRIIIRDASGRERIVIGLERFPGDWPLGADPQPCIRFMDERGNSQLVELAALNSGNVSRTWLKLRGGYSDVSLDSVDGLELTSTAAAAGFGQGTLRASVYPVGPKLEVQEGNTAPSVSLSPIGVRFLDSAGADRIYLGTLHDEATFEMRKSWTPMALPTTQPSTQDFQDFFEQWQRKGLADLTASLNATFLRVASGREGPPSLSIMEAGRSRTVIGSVGLEDSRTGKVEWTGPSSITLLDSEGKLLWRMP